MFVGDRLLQVLVQLEDLHLVDVLGDLGVDVALARGGVGHLQRHRPVALALAGARVEGDLESGDDELAVGPLRQAQVEDVARRLVALQGAQLATSSGAPPARSAFSSLISGTTWRTRLTLTSLVGRRCISTLRKPAAARLSNSSTKMRSASPGLVDVDVVPLALGQLGQVLDQAAVPLGADAHDGEVDLLLGGLLGQLPADVLAGGLAVGQDHDLRQLAGAGVLLDLVHGQLDALVHGGAARIDVEHVDLVDDVLDLGLVGNAAWAAGCTWALWAKATMARVSSGLSVLDGGVGGFLNALRAG